MGEKDGYEQAQEVFKELESDLVKAQAVKARLLNQLRTGYINVPFKDSDGEFHVKVRIPEPRLRDKMWMLFNRITKATNQGNSEDLIKLSDELSESLAQLTPELDAEYWKAGEGYNSEVPQKIMSIALGLDPVRLEELRFFSGSLVGEDFAAMLRWINLKSPSEWASLADEDKLFWQSAWGRFKEGLKRG